MMARLAESFVWMLQQLGCMHVPRDATPANLKMTEPTE